MRSSELCNFEMSTSPEGEKNPRGDQKGTPKRVQTK